METIFELVTVVLAISLAVERLVMIVRTPNLSWLQWLNEEKKTKKEDGARRLAVQLVSLVCAIVTTGFLAPEIWNPFESISIGGIEYPLLVVAFLSTGGSSFWKNILGYTKAARDINIEKANEERAKRDRT